MRRNFYLDLATRLSLAAVVIAAILGSAVWFYEIERIDDAVVSLAAAEARAFGDKRGAALKSGDIEGALKNFLAERERGEDGHFVFAEVYGRDRRALGEAALGDVQAVEAAFDRNAHPFPIDGATHYDRITHGEHVYLRVLTVLSAEGFSGYFEGIFQVAPARLAQIEESVLGAVLIVVGVVAGTTLFLVPVVVGVNRRLVKTKNELLRANVEILEVLGCAIAKRDSDTGQHNYRVTLYAVHLAQALGRSANDIRALIKGAFLHDVGKIAISDTILLKPGKLTDAEFAVMKTHVDHGVDIVARSNWLADARPVVAGHHEKYDGTGYPTGAAADAIPFDARIFAIVDVFDALTSSRPYKDAMPYETALDILRDGRSKHFDPHILDAFIKISADIYQKYSQRSEDELRDKVLIVTAKYF